MNSPFCASVTKTAKVRSSKVKGVYKLYRFYNFQVRLNLFESNKQEREQELQVKKGNLNQAQYFL